MRVMGTRTLETRFCGDSALRYFTGLDRDIRVSQ